MNFFLRKRKIVLDCFTHLSFVYDHTPIAPAIRHIPQWLKNTPATTSNNDPTVKSCIGLIEYSKKGIVIPSWFEMDLTIHEKDHPEDRWYDWNASHDEVTTDSHPDEQYDQYATPNGHNMKIISPWHFRTNKFVQFTWTQPLWHQRHIMKAVQILPAVVDYHYNHSTHINTLLINEKEPQSIQIEPNMPLVMLHPMTDAQIEIKNHLVSKKDHERIIGKDKLFLPCSNLYHKKRKLSCPR